VTGAVLCQARLAQDEAGQVRPEIIAGTEYQVECDAIMIAIGQVQQLEWLPGHLSDRGLITADEHGRVRGHHLRWRRRAARPRRWWWTRSATAKRAARDIDRLLTAQALAAEPPVEVMPYEKLNSAYFRHAPRIEAPLADPGGAPPQPDGRGHPGLQPRGRRSPSPTAA